jgi:hypothetical protein
VLYLYLSNLGNYKIEGASDPISLELPVTSATFTPCKFILTIIFKVYKLPRDDTDSR